MSRICGRLFGLTMVAVVLGVLGATTDSLAQSTGAGGGGDRPTSRLQAGCRDGDRLFRTAGADGSAPSSPAYLVCLNGRFQGLDLVQTPSLGGSARSCREGQVWVTAEFDERHERMASVVKTCRGGRYVQD